jgi:hypothetical protein
MTRACPKLNYSSSNFGNARLPTGLLVVFVIRHQKGSIFLDNVDIYSSSSRETKYSSSVKE